MQTSDYDLAVNHARELLYLMKVDGNLANGRVEFINGAVESLLGYEPREFIKNPDLWFSIIHPDDTAGLIKSIDEILKGRKIIKLTYRMRHKKTQEYRWMEDAISPRFNGEGKPTCLVGSAIDITDQKKTTNGLHDMEEHFRGIFENATIGIYRTSADGRILLANHALVSMLGFKNFEELQKRNLEEEGYEPDYRREEFRRRIEKDGVIKGFESAWKKKDGTILFVRESARLVRDDNGRTLYYEGTVEDITDRKSAEDKILRLNRILRTLSDINQLIVRESGRDILFKEACRILIRDSQYRMAWIGILDESGKVICPRACSGVEDGFLHDVPVTKGDTVEEGGTVGRVIRTGSASVCNDTENDPAYLPWRDEARRMGYRSAGSFPIHVAGKVVGALNVFAALPDSFAEEEIHLLSELADDIGFALLTIEVRAREQAANEVIKDREFWLNESQRVARVGSYIYDVSSGEWSSTSALDDILGLDASSKRNVKGWVNLLHPDDRGNVYSQVRKVYSGLKAVNVECRIVRYNDKGTRWIWATGEIVSDSAGRPIRLFGTVQDITERKLAEEALRNERILLRTLIDNLPHSVYVKDKDYRKIIANPANVSHTGLHSEAEVWGKTDFEMFSNELAEKFFEDDQKVIRDGQSVFNREEYIVDPSGKRRWLLTTKVPLRDENGGINGLVGIGIDITERKRAEEAQERERTLLRTLVDHLPLAVWVKDREYRKTVVNLAHVGRVAARLGRTDLNSEAEVLGKTDFEIYPKELAEEYFLDDQKIIRDGESLLDAERSVTDADGQCRWELISKIPLRDKGGEIIGLVGISSDITERKRAEETLQQERILLRTLIDHLPNAVFVKDKQYRKTIVNPAHLGNLLAHIGRIGLSSQKEILGKTDFEVYPKELAEEFFADDQKVIRDGQPVINREELGIDADGQKHWVLISKIPLRDKEGAITGLVGITTDITAQKEAEEALRASEAELRTLFDSMKDVIIVFDRDGTYLKIAPTNPKLLYKPAPELVGKALYETLPDKQADAFLSVIRQALRTGEPQDTEYSLNIGGTEVWFAAIVSPMAEDKVLWVARDITEHKLAEEALWKSEEALERITSSIDDAIYSIDGETGEFAYLSPAFERKFGYSLSDIIQMGGRWAFLSKVVEGDDFPTMDPVVNELHKHRVDNTPVWDRWWRCKDGSLLFIEDSSVPIYDGDRLVRIDGVLRDITGRKRAEEAVQRERILLRTLIDNLPHGIYVKDKECRKVIANPADVRNTGSHSEAEVVGKTDFDVFPGDMAGRFFEDDQRVIRDGLPVIDREEYVFDPDGKKHWLLTSKMPLLDEKAAIIGLVGIGIDITERRNAENELRQLSEFNKMLIQTLPFGLDIVDDQGEILFMSDKMKELSGGNFVGQKCWVTYKDNKQQCQECPLRSGITAGQTRTLETDGVLNGRSFQISHIGLVYKNKKAVLEVFQDITQNKNLQAQFIQAQKMESLGTLASGIAHDFNNILGIILGRSTLIEGVYNEPEEVSEGIRSITKAAERGASLVRQMLTFARKGDAMFVSVSINDLVNEIQKLIEETFPKTIDIVCNLSDNLPLITADSTQLHQVLLNLCVNARDAMSGNGTLAISTKLVGGEIVRSRFAKASYEEYVMVEVGDNGVGMDRATRLRIFEPFFTTKGSGKGTGLGLSVAYGIIESHKGFVDVESELGKGTKFRIYFPVPADKEGQIALAEELTDAIPSSEDSSHGPETVLVVEDEEMLSQLAEAILLGRGYHVLTARDGEEGLKLFREHRKEVTVVICDLGLPRLSGKDLARQIKEMEPEAKVIVASGYIDSDIRTCLEEIGVKHFLPKPYRLIEVLKTVREAIDGQT